MYLVGSGVVEMIRQRPALTARFGAGSLVGGLSLLGLESSDVVLRAESEATVVCVGEDELFDVQEDHFDLARALFAYMASERSGFMRALSLRKGSEAAVEAHDAGPPAEGLVS
jgi:CRP-like cAMP-binding protein